MNHLTSGGLSQDFSGSGQNWVTAKTKFESGGGGGGGGHSAVRLDLIISVFLKLIVCMQFISPACIRRICLKHHAGQTKVTVIFLTNQQHFNSLLAKVHLSFYFCVIFLLGKVYTKS